MKERYEDEIEEILGRLEASSNGSGPTGRFRAFSSALRGHALNIYTLLNRRAGPFIFISVCILLSAVVISALVPGIFGLVMLLVVILALIAYFSIGPSLANAPEKRWRGRYIEDDALPERTIWFQKLFNWLKSK
mgnify:CR=1 FL=1